MRLPFAPLRRRLLLIVVAAVLPLLVLAWLIVAEGAQRQRATLLASSHDTVRTAVAALDAHFDVAVSSLDALASSPRLRAGDLAGFRAEARALIDRRGWTNVVLSEPSGQQVMNARLPAGVALPRSVDPAGLATVVRTGRPLVGDLVPSPATGKMTFSVKVPVLQDGAVAYVLNAVLLPERVRAVIDSQALPADALVTVLDRAGHTAARSRNMAAWIGKPASPTLRALMRQGPAPGWSITHTLEGDPVYTVFHHSTRSGWSIAMGVPVAAVEGPVARSYRILALGIALSAALGMAAALAIGRSLVGPVADLEQAAIRMGRGEAPLPLATRVPELRRVGTALEAAWREREALLAEERVLRAGAERTSQAKDEFLAMLGHELRNPLAPILNAAQLLGFVAANEARVRELARVLERQASHLARLVNDLLDVSRVTRRLITLEMQTLDLNALLPEALEQVHGQAAARDLALAVVPSAVPALVRADRTRLIQVVANLLQNAVKFTPDGGHVWLTVAVLPELVRLEVRDDGIGIDALLLPQVFDLFKQAERTLDRAQGGLGIGLSLTQGLVSLHGGTIAAASAGLGLGATFTVDLPRAPAHRAAA